ncbi:MAG: 5-formyltetrahydrofolate cyclo-ligase [Alphaproteobacteria bacterium]|nr:5-formyltetrahydrofolate cyclo-ligase [Alphaproteobacteria bacterium]
MTLDEDKSALRRTMLAWRAGLGETERAVAADTLVAVMRRERPVEAPAIVSGFWPIKDEIDIRPLMTALLNDGCRLALPVVHKRGEPLSFRAWRPGDALEAGAFGTLQPSASCETLEPDALLVPLLAWDEDGYRLGYGGGFYDRTLLGLRQRRSVLAIGVGFDAQLVGSVPHGPDDERLDWLLTPERACAFV